MRLIWGKFMEEKCPGGKNYPNIKTGKKHKRPIRESKNLLALFAIVTEL